MLPAANLFIFALATCCLCGQQCSATSTAVVGSNSSSETSVASGYPTHECGSMDIRNHCDSFAHLENCTVITGYLIIVLLPAYGSCDVMNHTFPRLREITDFMMMHDVKHLTSIKQMFPNLTVIRGQQLFLNYALGITVMHHLTKLEFPSLIAIQRGHVLVAQNPKLCFLNMINFSRLTLAPGDNHIYPSKEASCPKIVCNGCASGCWSNETCQKNENDNIISYVHGIQHCDAECLGGCYNRTAQGCAVCRSWTDNGSCVKECPKDKYVSKSYLRCYTREQCIGKGLHIHKMNCVSTCPTGYKLNNATSECDSCAGVNGCPKICQPLSNTGPIWIYTLADLERYSGCQIMNGSLFISMRSIINETELEDHLGQVTEIYGHLKISLSHHITTLRCFKNLKKIHGNPLENQLYAIVLYNNRNLRELWSPSADFELVNGGIYIQYNDRLCNGVKNKFKRAVKHNLSMDTIQASDKDVLCSPAKLLLHLEALSHRSIKLSWPMDQTVDEVEIIYRPVPADTVVFNEPTELDTRVCERIIWQRELVFPSDLSPNGTHYSYSVDNLEAHTKYVCLVKTFGAEDYHEARSELKFVTTQIDIPPPPLIRVYKKSFNSLAVQLYYENQEDELVDFYSLDVYEIKDNNELLDQRDYCHVPMKTYGDYHNEDYDDCCSRRLEEKDDDLFRRKLTQEFACSLDQKEFCDTNSVEEKYANKANVLLTKRLEHSETNYTIRSLERFQLYSIQVQACNSAGCGSFNIINERTNYSVAADKIYDLTACKMADNKEYRLHFKEPTKPNGHIASYILHFRDFDSTTNGPYKSAIRCLSRLQHERNSYLYTVHMNSTFNQAAVKVESFGCHTFTDYVHITPCSEVQWNTSTAGHPARGWNIFVICFLVGGGGTLLWIFYKRKYWQNLSQLRRYLPMHVSWRSAMRPERRNTDDRQILVEDYETVRFHNTSAEDEAVNRLIY